SECFRLALAPDGRTLAVGCERERIVWDLPDCRLVRCSPATGPCLGLSFLPDGRRLVWHDADDLRLLSLSADGLPAFFDGRYLRNVTAHALSSAAGLWPWPKATS